MIKTSCQLMAEQALHDHREHYHAIIDLKQNGGTEYLDNYKDKKGFFMKKFLINDKLNLNNWRVTWDAITKDIHKFVGKPVVLTPDKDHPPVSEQEDYRVGTIIDVGLDEVNKTAWQVSQIFDEKAQKMIKNKEVEFGSPTVLVYSEETREQQHKGTDYQKDILHRFIPAHDALVGEPAYGRNVDNIPAVCTGDGPACALKLLAVSASTKFRESQDKFNKKSTYFESMSGEINGDNTDQLTIVPFVRKIINDRFSKDKQAEIVGHIMKAKSADNESCVSRKIRIIMDEHPKMEHDQAIAIAYSYCGEPSKKAAAVERLLENSVVSDMLKISKTVNKEDVIKRIEEVEKLFNIKN